MRNSFFKMLDSTFWQTGELYDMSEICQNVKKVDYQGAEKQQII